MTPNTRLRSERLIEALEKAARDRRLTKFDIAQATGLHINTLQGFAPKRPPRTSARRRFNPKLATLVKLERYLLMPKRYRDSVSTDS